MVIATRLATEELNRANVLTDRIRKLKEEFLGAKLGISAQRARIATRSWKETEGEPAVMRVAKAFERILTEIPIFIRQGELIVGSETEFVRGAAPPVEWLGELLEANLQNAKPIVGRVTSGISEEDRKSLLEDMEYWKKNSVYTAIHDACQRVFGSLIDDVIEARIFVNIAGYKFDATSPDYDKLLERGLKGIVAEASEGLEKLNLSSREDVNKLYLYEAAILSCKAVIQFAHKHAELARQLAGQESNPVRKAELEKIAEACSWVPENPPRTFHEALQSFWFLLLTSRMESSSFAEVIGRWDQYLYPFYEKDVKQGAISRQEAAELFACLWLKLLTLQSMRESGAMDRGQGSEFINATIAGVTPEGEDASNELTYLILEVARQLKPHQPHLSFRYHDGINDEVFLKALETERDIGAGIPQFMNDKVNVARFLSLGVPLKDARNWAAMGCAHPRIPGSGTDNLLIVISLAKIFELALNNGIDPRTGKRLGLATGDPRKFASLEEVIVAFKKQASYFFELVAKYHRIAIAMRGAKAPVPFGSAITGDCLKEGKVIFEGGARYPQLSNQVCDRGHVNVADSLTAMRKLLFEEKKLTMDELLDALQVNFEGKEDLRQMLLAAPKFGNDDNEADGIMKELFSWTAKEIAKQTNPWGYPLLTERHGSSYHYWAGKTVGALPDGRKAYTSIADGGCSPMTSMDSKGPTAVINSASKLDHILCGVTVLNQKFSPTALQTREQLRKLGAMIKTYFDQYGHHIQYNVVSKDTLLEAKKHPERYRDLIVRIAGYSAFFVELAPEIQDEIIARTEYTSC